MAATIDLIIPTGVTWRRVLLWEDAEGARVSLANRSAHMQVRERPGATILLDLSSEDGTILLEVDEVDDDATGTITLLVAGPLTAEIVKTTARYDLKLSTVGADDGEPSDRLVGGTVTFDLGITTP